ncbi:MAG: helicase HerA domain-containing protein [Promethearchaeota archaeon]
MDKPRNDQKTNPIAKITGKSTPYSFTVNILSDIHRNSYLTTIHENKSYIFGVKKIWNDQNGNHATLNVIGEAPLTPFNLDSEIFLASNEQIINSLGLEKNPEKSINLGKILNTNIKATLNIEKLGRLFITGKSGSGKSYTVGVVIEELMKKQIPIVIIDRHGEYSSLKILEKDNIPEKEDFFRKDDSEKKYMSGIIEFGDINMNPGVDLGIEYLLASNLEDLIRSGNIIIINLRGLEIPVQEHIVDTFCYRLYKASTLHEIPPHFLFIDEAHLFAGKKKNKTVEVLKLSAQEGRKFGHNLVIITQKPQLLDVVIRAQAGTWIIHKLTDLNDIKITCNSVEGLGIEADEEIQNLLPGEALISGDLASYYPLRVKIRLRYTVHGGAGYNVLDYINEGEILPKSEIVEKLKRSFTPEIIENVSKEIISNQKLNISDLYHQIDALRKQNQDLKQEISDLTAGKKKETLIPEEEGKENMLDNIVELNSIPAEKINDKMMELMEERDDALIKIKELEKERDEAIVQKQSLELEISGLKVENEGLKDEFIKERKRADDAVAVAERVLFQLKKRK